MEFEHLVRPQAGHGEHFEHACGDILAHGLKARVITGCVKLGNDIGDGVANPWDFLQATLRHDVLQGLGEGQEIFGCPRIGLGTVGIATTQGGPLPEFVQKSGNLWSVKFCRGRHNGYRTHAH